MLIIFAVLSCVVSCVQSRETYSKMQTMLELEEYLSKSMENVLKSKILKLSQISSRLKNLAQSHVLSKSDIDTPIQALTLVRRLAEDWTTLAGMIQEKYGLSQLGLGAERWPNSRHVQMAAYTIMRTQWTYGQDTKLLAEGIISGVKSVNMTAADCWHVGQTYWSHSLVEEAVEWHLQAWFKVDAGDVTISRHKAVQGLSLYLCYSDGKLSTRALILNLLKHNMKRDWSMDENLFLECQTVDEKVNSAKQGLIGNVLNAASLEQHKRLCRVETAKSLRCRYLHYSLPHLRLQPFKVEELHDDPPVLRFYDVFTDYESEHMIKLALKSMYFQADYRDGVDHYDNFRTSKGAFVDFGESQVHDKLYSKMEDMTQISLESSEATQVTRYGISGEYLTHTDYFDDPKVPFERNRLAVLLFYLNDVKEGGNTIFPELNLSVKPIKNSAILWFNFLPSGQEDPRSAHSGCPVVQGTKWVLVKFLANGGQEFKKPCGLHKDDSFAPYYIH